MKIIKLTAENIKRLSAVEITPEGTLITVGGKNGAGKSSVLDSIAYALGGQALVPDKPVREGETSARVEIDLGDLKVERRFKLQSLPCNCVAGVSDIEHNSLCDSRKEPNLTSTLIVRDKEGNRFTGPQAVLNNILGRLSFDPLDFARSDNKSQAATLRDLVGFDTSKLDKERKEIYDERTGVNHQVKMAEAKIAMSTFHKNLPEEPISLSDLSKQMLEAEEKLTARKDAETKVEQLKGRIENGTDQIGYINGKIKEVEIKLQDLNGKKKEMEFRLDDLESQMVTAVKEVTKCEEEEIDTTKLKKQIEETEFTNQKIRENIKYLDNQDELSELKRDSNICSEVIAGIDKKKKHYLEAIEFPIKGLNITDDVVTYNGVPLEQASTAEKVKISVAIGIALNPKLKVLLVRDGNVLDNDSLAEVAKQASDSDAQLWVERVAETSEGVSVMIEDGTVI
jgi:predicted ATP-dependent endonuclease of OLD family